MNELCREMKFSKKAKIVSLVPSLTELFCELALTNQLIGVTEQCSYPFYIKSTKVVVGNAKNPFVEKIEALQPEVIFCDAKLHSAKMISELKKIAFTYVVNIKTINEGKEFVQQLGKLLDCRTESVNFIQKLEYKITDFKNFVRDREPKTVAFFVSANPWKVIHRNPFIDELFLLNKFENIYNEQQSEKEIKIKGIRFQGDPNVLLLASDIFEFTDENAFEIGKFANQSATAFVDSKMFTWFGVRTLQAFDYFKQLHKRLESHF